MSFAWNKPKCTWNIKIGLWLSELDKYKMLNRCKPSGLCEFCWRVSKIIFFGISDRLGWIFFGKRRNIVTLFHRIFWLSSKFWRSYSQKCRFLRKNYVESVKKTYRNWWFCPCYDKLFLNLDTRLCPRSHCSTFKIRKY